ncbi:DUF4296 domain-containing protein [Flavobacterium granuli]|uniref:DUF4296 domain-containing protein n=1 Tax=Flavobacterium granuli TaxID=280093 RepID=A0ABU1S2Z7_9FLAO|nr:DUF4296 domain-containing protein [Flavobacterium granuli]MDR6845407.1 hypothetical protein [Flavobacterium granuli]
MRKIISLFALVTLFLSCNKDLVEKPDNLIDKKVMGDILYDMSILEALKYQNPNSLYKNGINPKSYIYKKYKIDSIQFVKSNAYYAADYREYKKMYDALNDRLIKEKKTVDLIVKKESKKVAALKKAKAKKVQDSIKKAKKIKDLKVKKEKDSIAQKNQEIKSKK